VPAGPALPLSGLQLDQILADAPVDSGFRLPVLRVQVRGDLRLADGSGVLHQALQHLRGQRGSLEQRQRVFLAICLSLHPDTLMLDEPTSALDEATAGKVMENIVGFVKKHKKCKKNL
jgi:ABC-type sulfate/molybdate transport systems ATPase subunit